MSTSISPIRRFAVTAAMVVAAVFGSVALAPAASAEESAPIVESAPAPEVAPAPEPVPASEVVPVPEAAPAPAPAPEAAPAPAPAPQPEPAPAPTAPPVVYDKNGKPIEPPTACTAAELEKALQNQAQRLRLADSFTAAAQKLRDASAQLRAQAAKAQPSKARLINALATASDRAAQLLEEKAAELVDAALILPCIPEGGGRF